ncbi:MAG: lysophospholipase [Bacteroidales bacterium]|nr:lysophospholipase [Bacteroidales bacterium]
MVHQEYSWKSKDGTTLFGQCWMPDKQPHALINYVHGFMDHSTRFTGWAERLCNAGYAVAAIDLRGHGRSEGRRGYARHFSLYLQDIHTLCENSQALFPDCSSVLYGHSLGGNLVANFLISENPLPKAAIISSPWFTLTRKPPLFQQLMASMVRYTLPGLRVKSTLDPEGLSHNRQVVSQYNSDPLVHHSILPRLFFEIEHYGIKASQSIYKINLPLLVMHGNADPITSFKQTAGFVRNAGRNTTFKEWPAGYHEIHNEPNEAEVFNYLLNWLNNRNFVRS